MLKIANLNVSYGKRRILKDISLEVQSGELVALIGPNGAGKSTLIRAVSGVIPVDGGLIRTNGDDLLALPPMKRARYISVVPQSGSLPKAYTVHETVLMGRTPYLNFIGQTSPQDEALVERTLEKIQATELAERPVGELSGGEQQRVLLARALAQATPIMLLDEPTAHLDLHHQVSLLDLVHALTRQEHLAVLIALHDLNLAAQYADQIALLVDGQIAAVGKPAEVLRPDLLSHAYQIPTKVIKHPFVNRPLVLPDTTRQKNRGF